MSHIYDALKKSRGEEPVRPDAGSGGSTPPPEPPAAPPSSKGDQPLAPLVPDGKIQGRLLGEPNTSFLRELDTLRGNVDVLLSRQSRQVVCFTGAVPGEGSTTLAVHYAYLISSVVGKRVLLVDGDMARSHLSLSDAIGERAGLSELLTSDLPLESAIVGTEDPKLHFLPAGQDQIHHIEAVTSGPIRSLLDHLGERYDAVVIDSAPVLEHPESPLIGAACDGVVLVVRAERMRWEIAQRALRELNIARCRILGSVLNAWRPSLPSFLSERV
ncbi:MAG: CpsD/CapB family tyrosine-protein kinase [Candidatus Eisenbacteria sp.]|nr:CpsD/CapB family tyrosine-protein kinase [Candidatus Eisenbacteria bacterium]